MHRNTRITFVFAHRNILKLINSLIMSEQQLRSYRLTSMEEPTDEMLHAIMEKVAESARKSTARAEEAKRRMLAETASLIKKHRTAVL